LQIYDIDDGLRNALWDFIFLSFIHIGEFKVWRRLGILWFKRLKERPFDEAPSGSYWDIKNEIREVFFSAEWFEIYDYLEVILNDWNKLTEFAPGELVSLDKKVLELNRILESKLSAYRFVGKGFIAITDTRELEEIGSAITTAEEKRFSGVAKHLQKAAGFLGPAEKSDFENSVKESISAVESLVLSLTGEKRGKFEKPIRDLTTRLNIHRALGEGLIKLYGYASEEEGARHCILDGSTLVGYEEAHFMLVTCAATVNYIFGKKNKADSSAGFY